MASGARSGLRRYVRIGLLVVLGFLLLALAQDRLRARPAVLRAYEMVERINAAANDSPTAPATGNGDVQAALRRRPSRMTTHGPYTVEVYSWMAGIPWRSHDYFVVYAPGDDRLVLVTHYSYVLPPYRPPRVITMEAGAEPPNAMGPGGPRFGPGGETGGIAPGSPGEFGADPRGPEGLDRVRRPSRPDLEAPAGSETSAGVETSVDLGTSASIETSADLETSAGLETPADSDADAISNPETGPPAPEPTGNEQVGPGARAAVGEAP